MIQMCSSKALLLLLVLGSLFHWVISSPGSARPDPGPQRVSRNAEPSASVGSTQTREQVLNWGYLMNAIDDELSPPRWQDTYPACSGLLQSPLAISSRFVVTDPSLKPLDFSTYYETPRGNNWTVVNNSHVVEFQANFENPPELRQGSLGENYVFKQFHLHWGAQDSRGSEHIVDQKQYPLEMHLVHRKVTDTDQEALMDHTGLAVLGILFELVAATEPTDVYMEVLINGVLMAVNPNGTTTVNLPGFALADLIPDSSAYYRYLGSLTTPPCAESVLWTVMKKPMKITATQLNILRSLHKKHGVVKGNSDLLADNFRPPQSANGRLIRYRPDYGNVMSVREGLPASIRLTAIRTAVFRRRNWEVQ